MTFWMAAFSSPGCQQELVCLKSVVPGNMKWWHKYGGCGGVAGEMFVIVVNIRTVLSVWGHWRKCASQGRNACTYYHT